MRLGSGGRKDREGRGDNSTTLTISYHSVQDQDNITAEQVYLK